MKNEKKKTIAPWQGDVKYVVAQKKVETPVKIKVQWIGDIDYLIAQKTVDRPINETGSAVVKQYIKTLANLFPCEWDEALEEMEKK